MSVNDLAKGNFPGLVMLYVLPKKIDGPKKIDDLCIQSLEFL
jgi:hypothetical protein